MAEDVLKLPFLKLEIPKPKRWDFVALAVAIAGIAAIAANIAVSGARQPGVQPSTTLSVVFVLVHLTVACVGLLVLGKTSKEGTIHGNLLSIAAMSIGLLGVMLAAALWAAA